MKVFSWGECDRLLRRAGFVRREAKGSHALYTHPKTGAITGLKMNHPGACAGASVSHLVSKLVEQTRRKEECDEV